MEAVGIQMSSKFECHYRQIFGGGLGQLSKLNATTLVMIYNRRGEMSLVLAVNFFPKKTSPGSKVAVNPNFPAFGR